MPSSEQIRSFLLNPIFLSCVSSWFCCQLIKTICTFGKHKVTNAKEFFDYLFFRTGSMPSSHSALAAALTTSIFILEFDKQSTNGVSFLAFFFYLVIIRDATGVRRSGGEQAKKINELGESLKEKGLLAEYEQLKEVKGHTPLEVLVGTLIGLIFGITFHFLNLKDLLVAA